MTSENILAIDPNALRRLASQHDEAAQTIRRWARMPTEWLGSFQNGYGKIAEPVRLAMQSYFEARVAAGNILADKHLRVSASLRTAADIYEHTDAAGASAINSLQFAQPTVPSARIPSSSTHGSGPENPVRRHSPLSGTVRANGTSRWGPAATPWTRSAEDPYNYPVGTGKAAHDVSEPVRAHELLGSGPAVGDPVVQQSKAESTSTPPITGTAADMDRATSRPGSTEQAQVPSPVPPIVSAPLTAAHGFPPSPLGAAAAARTPIGPAQPTEEITDLIVARTLLSAVLSAVDRSSAPSAWAVSVMRGPQGARIFITSNEGRGWLPAGLYLPPEVSTPWMFNRLVESGGTASQASWERLGDPARILAEFATEWGSRTDTTLTALASSEPIPASVVSSIAGAESEQLVRPSGDPLLRTPGANRVDRLALTSSAQVLHNVMRTPAPHLRKRQIDLAVHAHQQLVNVAVRPPHAAHVPGLRDRILAAVQSDFVVPPPWWEELRTAHQQLALSLEEGPNGVAALMDSDRQQTHSLGVYFDRRSNEIVLLLAGNPTHQTLRDSVYAHREIVNHPAYAGSRAVPSTSGYTNPPQRAVAADIDARTAPGTRSGPGLNRLSTANERPALDVIGSQVDSIQ
ncbi:ESX-1 secretion-associated protein [Nocardia sp. NBC_00416]|uniref:ESX-1 secretion-associated protein n=1 Tax=Nocardia sp. NBC_00416 TaxID=2975991 RepID=UPI002E1E4987